MEKIQLPLQEMVQLVDMVCSTAKGISFEEFSKRLFPEDDTPLVLADRDDCPAFKNWTAMQADFASWFRGLDIAYKRAFTLLAFNRCEAFVPSHRVTLEKETP